MRALVHYFRVRFAVLPLIEALVLVQSMVLGYEVRLIITDPILPAMHGVLFASVMVLAMTALGLYSDSPDSFRMTVQRIFAAYLITLLALTGVFYLLPDSVVTRGVFAMASVFALAGLLLVRWVAWRMGMMSMPGRRVLVVGDGDDARQVIDTLAATSRLRVARFVAQVADFGPEPEPVVEGAPARVRGPLESLPVIVDQQRITDIVVAVQERRGGQVPLPMLLECKLKGARVHDLVSFYEQELGLIRLSTLRASWLVYGHGFDQSTMRVVVKRIFDIVVSASLLTVALPVMAIAALAVVIESGRPILFRQERVREYGQTFSMMKFRSMRQNAESDGRPRWATTDDDRVTRVGRFIRSTRIDELPQLFNVLMGDMSFVGPRPERPFFVNKLTDAIPYYGIRHNVKPGITGWAQVRLPYGASVDDAKDKLEYDLYYVKNHSFFLDMMILFETVQVVLRKQGAR